MPSRTSVAQQSGVEPLQSEGVTQPTVSAGAHESAQTAVSFVRSAQQTCVPVHGTAGQVAPASPPPLPLPELLPPEPLEEPLLEALPELPPPLLDPPPEELLEPPSPPLPGEELLPPHATHGSAPAQPRTRAAAKVKPDRVCMGARP